MRSGELAAVSRHSNLWSLKTGRFLPGHNSTYREIYWQYSLLMHAHDFAIVKSTWALGTSMLATIFFAKQLDGKMDLWWWLPLRLSKRQSTPTTVLLRTTLQPGQSLKPQHWLTWVQTFHCYKMDLWKKTGEENCGKWPTVNHNRKRTLILEQNWDLLTHFHMYRWN